MDLLRLELIYLNYANLRKIMKKSKEHQNKCMNRNLLVNILVYF